MKKLLCKLFGHQWTHKTRRDENQNFYSPFLYNTSRECSRCNKRQISLNKPEEEYMYFI